MVKAIATLDFLAADLFDNYRLEVAVVPSGLAYQKAPWECDDRSIAIPHAAGSLWFRVYDGNDPTPIAHATFAADHEVVRCDTIEVDVAHRQRGIANSLYVHAACIFEARVVPSGTLLDGGERFWRGREFIECPPSDDLIEDESVQMRLP